MTSAGDLRHEIRLDRLVTVPDGAGGSTTSWEEVATMPAHIRFLKGGETVMAGRLASVQTLVVTVRNQSGLGDADTTWRLTSTRSGRVYDIRAITPDERAAFVDFLCQTGAF